MPADFVASKSTKLALQNIQDIHLRSHLDDEIEAGGNINNVYMMAVIGLFIILIACFNFINLSTARATKRAKEVGLRKVMGASVTQIVAILSKEFLLLVFIAFAIAAPVAWWAVNKWLQDFAYRTAMSWWIFAASGLSLIIVALLTLSIQTIKSALANPVKSLRTE